MKKRKLDNYVDVLTTNDVQYILQISRNPVYALLKSGELESFRIGRKYRIPKSKLKTYIYNTFK